VNNSNFEKPPFEELYASVVGTDARIYKKISQAKSRITNNIDRDTELFKSDCEIWTVGDNGWELFFVAQKGDHESVINWKNSFQQSKRRREKAIQRNIEEKLKNERELYEKLKVKFDKD